MKIELVSSVVSLGCMMKSIKTIPVLINSIKKTRTTLQVAWEFDGRVQVIKQKFEEMMCTYLRLIQVSAV